MGVHVDKVLAVDDGQCKNLAVADVDEEELEELKELADADSLFCKIVGVQVHHKIFRQELKDGEEALEGIKSKMPTILFHGFCASVFSWEGVMKPLGQLTGSEVLAFDRPAFGITSRPPAPKSCSGRDGGYYSRNPRLLNPYSTAFSVFAALSFMDLLGGERGKTVLIGHSAGCLVAAETYFQAPDKVSALIMVAPAILAPFTARKSKMLKGNGAELNIKEEDGFSDWAAGLNFNMVISLVLGMRKFVASVCVRVLSAFLKSSFALILIRLLVLKFGVQFAKTSWFDASQVTDHVLKCYTKPLKTKGWEKALLEYILALLTDSSSKQPLSRRLAHISCPVLIITGDTDRIVPSWNSERLSRVIPGSTFEVIKNCGHIPHEEKKEEFMFVVKRFLDRVRASS